MPEITADDGVKLHHEEVGAGIPIVFVHPLDRKRRPNVNATVMCNVPVRCEGVSEVLETKDSHDRSHHWLQWLPHGRSSQEMFN